MHRLALAVLAVSLVTTTTAAAQPGLTEPTPTSSSTEPVADTSARSPSVAVLISLGATVGGYVTMFAADDVTAQRVGFAVAFLGPSAGRWYAGDHGLLSLGARALGGASMIYGFSLVLGSESDCEPGIDGDCTAVNQRARRAGTGGAVLMWTGIGLWVGSSIYDVIQAKHAADRWNARHSLTVAPTLVGSVGDRSPGLVVSGRF